MTKFGVFDRGYTGHEHLLGVGLVHMNGRLYEPVVHRFLMPDNFVQDPYNTQSYNRYGYVLNNPLLYSDPSGEIIPLLIIGAALVGAYIGGAQANGTWNPLKWDYKSSGTWIGIVGGAAIGVVSAGIGIAVTAAITPALASLGITGGILGGAITGIATGTAAGAFSGGFSSILPGGSGNFWDGVVRGAVMGAITGGILGASIGGLMTPKGHNVWTGVAPRAAVAPVSTMQATGVSTIDDAASIKTEVLTSKIASPAPSTNPSVAPAATTPIKDGMGIVEVNIRPVQNPLDLVGSQGLKPVGSYLLEFEGMGNTNMFYAGKGPYSRMLQSINRIENTFGDKIINSTFIPANTAKDAFIQEHIFMMQFGGPKSFNPFSPTYNLIFSPGKKLGGF
ncbi:RHS repeat domain-containing protein [Gelidibacter algens]|uniref:RHS repeat domain-containing protein n=1 Tax=Gelidibacter algens TaxID=49280 RepID=UPI0021CE8928|nr:RHS repeat-associated core domain-containing protein [Gelidibacter algens]